MTFLRVRSVFYSLKKLFSTAVESGEIEASSLASKVTIENQYDALSDVITPLWKAEYCEQVLFKKKWSKAILNTFKTKHLPKANTILHPVIPSPQIVAYRNTDQFNVQTGIDGDPKTVGYFIGSGSRGDVLSIPPIQLMNVKADHKEIAKAFQDFIRASPLKACHVLNDGGCWRGVEIKSNQKGDIMAVIYAHPSGIPEGELDNIKESATTYFQERTPSVKSLYMQLCPHTKCTPEQAPYILLYGTPYIFENIDRYNFRISPSSYYHINTDSVPLLYECALKFTGAEKNYTLFDINCGIGTFSMFASSHVRGCVGIDSSNTAIEDAKFNVLHNNLSNCHFEGGNVAKVLKELLKEHDATMNISAVISSGRINRELVKILRRCVQLKKLVYISSRADNPTSFRNFIDLCHPKFDLSNPFQLKAIQPIDMAPQTKFCVLVLLFQR